MKGGRTICTVLAMLSFAAMASGQDVTTRIRYLSAEHVYIDAGAALGVSVGMTAEVRRDGTTIAVLEVLHSADHSASCRVVARSGDPLVGDEVVVLALEEAAPPDNEPAPVRTPSRTRAVPAQERGADTPGAGRELSGSVGVQWDHTTSEAGTDLRSDFWSLPFRLTLTGLGGGWEWRARGSFRRFERSGYLGSSPEGEWRNRIREMALVRDDPDAAWQLAFGRVRSRETGTVGPFDGARAVRRLGSAHHLGIFGGFAPEWGTLAFGTDDHVAGMTWRLERRTESGRHVDLNLAAIGRYRGGEISREYLTWSASWRNGARLSLLQAAEIDVNRGWRRDVAGAAGIELTSVALTARWQAARSVDVDLGFDDRELVRTWESRSLPDSLFQDSGRKGWRAGLTMRGRGGRRLAVSASLRRDRRQDADITSWQARFLQPRLGRSNVGFNIVVRGFDGPYLSGWAPQGGFLARAGATRIGLDAGKFLYRGVGGREDRNNTWSRIRLSRDLTQDISIAAEFRRDWGDDIAGKRWWLEFRRSF